ncbi:hypothetical protein D3C73_1193070 [compost metagenome]
MTDVEEGLAFFQGDSTLVLVVTVRQLGAQVQFDLAAVLEGDLANVVGRLEMLIRVRQPAHVPTAVGRQRQGQRTHGGGHAEGPPGRLRPGANQGHNRFRTRQVASHFPDLEHGLVFGRMQWMNV